MNYLMQFIYFDLLSTDSDGCCVCHNVATVNGIINHIKNVTMDRFSKEPRRYE
jgi:hypothetical protein